MAKVDVELTILLTRPDPNGIISKGLPDSPQSSNKTDLACGADLANLVPRLIFDQRKDGRKLARTDSIPGCRRLHPDAFVGPFEVVDAPRQLSKHR